MAADAETMARKQLGEAERALKRLTQELERATAGLRSARIDPGKLRSAHARVHRFLKRHRNLARMAGGRAFDSLSEATQARLLWFEREMAALVAAMHKGRWVERSADLDPARDPDRIIADIERARRQWSFQGLGTLKKHLEAGVTHAKDGGMWLGLVPIAIFLAILAAMIHEILSRRPKD
ncbi:MAG: hypothetical protein KatS3mg118_2964 [Paracoccaceae bacterium]|nr:MAG: hypothetical protein KatS3mg118_2964 [Paracoccaceae bacterium]